MRKTLLILISATLFLAGQVTALDMNSSKALQYYDAANTDGNLDFQVNTDGTVDVYGNLDMNRNKIGNINRSSSRIRRARTTVRLFVITVLVSWLSGLVMVMLFCGIVTMFRLMTVSVLVVVRVGSQILLCLFLGVMLIALTHQVMCRV